MIKLIIEYTMPSPEISQRLEICCRILREPIDHKQRVQQYVAKRITAELVTIKDPQCTPVDLYAVLKHRQVLLDEEKSARLVAAVLERRALTPAERYAYAAVITARQWNRAPVANTLDGCGALHQELEGPDLYALNRPDDYVPKILYNTDEWGIWVRMFMHKQRTGN